MEAIRRRTIVKDVLWIIATIGVVSAIFRFERGLGAATGMSDAVPWGIWIGFDVMGGVALAAGGFVMAATVYIFHLEKYHPLLRPAILTAFLGYISVIVGLLCDIGRPWNIWKPLIFWQFHSVLFEVAWCVMLYATVLFLEFSPTILEHPLLQFPILQKVAYWLKRLTLPLVILGIGLSTLHQSSLGSLFLIMPFRLHPLWYSPIIPIQFFVSAVALGLGMVTLESFASAYLYGHKTRVDLFSGLGRAASWVLWLYLVIRLGNLVMRGLLPTMFDGSWQSILFWGEIAISALIPATLLSVRPVRNNRTWLLVCSIMIVFGMVMNRLVTGLIAHYRPEGIVYFPAWTELGITLGILAGLVLVFLFFVENLKVFDLEDETEHVETPAQPMLRRPLLVAATAALAAVCITAQPPASLVLKSPPPASTPATRINLSSLPFADMPHPTEGHEDCLLCHSVDSLTNPSPATHVGRTNATCLSCHSVKPGIGAASTAVTTTLAITSSAATP